MDTILLVEDNEQIMEINEWYLSQRGFRILKAYSLAQARECLAVTRPDLVILDVILPDGDGLLFCEEIRKKQTMPILFLTGMVTDKDVMAGYRNGGNDYLTKPYDLDMLGVRVDALLNFAKGMKPRDRERSFGPLRFDLIQSEASVNGTPLYLSQKEFRLLYQLARHHGETVSREELFREVWGMEMGADSPMLWTAISRLKKKILPYAEDFYLDSDHSGYALVLTRHGRGSREGGK